MNQNIPSSKPQLIVSGDKSEFRFLIPSKVASVIIGKGGERIKRLRQECNARLSIPDNTGPERIFTVEGTIENCVTIWKECFFECKDFMGNRDPENDELDIRLLYHTTLVGNIIGKGGETIKNLKSNYDVSHVKVYAIPTPMSTDRVVQIVGNIDRVFEVVREMVEIMSKQSPKGEIIRYDSTNSDEFTSTEYGGWGSTGGNRGGGSGGRGGRGGFNGAPRGRGGASSGSFNRSPFPGSNAAGGPPSMSGGGGPSRMRAPGPGGPRAGAPGSGAGGAPRWNAPGSGAGGAPRGGGRFSAPRMDGSFQVRPLMGDRKRSDNFGGNTDFQNKRPRQQFDGGRARVRLPKNCLDYLNDKNGEMLWNIMNDSGAEINVDNTNLDNINEAVLSISGTKDQIEGAQYLLQICVKKFVLQI